MLLGSDVARPSKLAVENQKAGARHQSVAEEGVPVRDIAEADLSAAEPILPLPSGCTPQSFALPAGIPHPNENVFRNGLVPR
jgi:hypothetical protein